MGRRKNMPVDVNLTADPQVSRPHARLFYDLGTWWVEDLGGKHGTWLNEQVITEAKPLSPDDKLQMGGTVLKVEFGPMAGLPSELSLESQATVDEVEPPADLSEDERNNIFLKVNKVAATTANAQSLLDRFLEVIGDYFPRADHRSILLRDEAKELIPAAAWPFGPVAQVSYTLARRISGPLRGYPPLGGPLQRSVGIPAALPTSYCSLLGTRQ